MFVPLVHGSADLDRQVVTIQGRETKLTPNEARLLRYLAERPGQTVEKDELLQEVFGYAASVRSRTVATTMQRLRKKIEPDPGEPFHLKSVYGRGYCFEPLGEEGGLVGRDAVLGQLRAMLERERRVWVVAPGGYGKTSLVRQLVEQGAIDHVWVELAGATTAAELAGATCAALGIAPLEGFAPLRGALSHRAPALLVLDAAEDLGDEVRAFLREAVGEQRVVVTSRMPPTGEPILELGALDPSAAQRLFERCTPRTLAPERVRALLGRLGGVPLALQLAGARLRLFAPEDLEEQLDRLSGVLTGGEGRHASMEQVLAWSFEHMRAGLRDALGRLAPARRGLAVADAVVLVGDPGLAVLEELAAWGWLTLDEGRVQMLDPVRQFVEARTDRPAAEAAHRRLFLQRTREHEHELLVGRAKGFLDAERANLRAALRTGWAVGASESIELALLLVPTMGQRVAMAEALQWLDAASRIARGPVLGDVLVLRAALWMSRSSLDAAEADLLRAESLGVRDEGLLALRWGRWHQERLELVASRERLTAAAEQLEGPWHLQAQLALAYTLVKGGWEEDALRLLRQVLARARVDNAPSPTLLALGTLGVLHTRRDDFEAARRAHLEALQISEKVGLDLVAARVHTQLGAVELYRGDTDAAAHHWSMGMEISGRLGARVGVAMAQVNLANLALVTRELPRADTMLVEAEQIFEEAGFAPGLAYARLGRARLASLRQQVSEAERLFAACRDDLPLQLQWLVGVQRCLMRAEQGDGAGARQALQEAAEPTDAGSRAGRRVAEAFCALLTTSDAEEQVAAALAEAASIRDPVIQELAERLRRFAERVEQG